MSVSPLKPRLLPLLPKFALLHLAQDRWWTESEVPVCCGSVCANSLLSFTFFPQTDNPPAAQLDKVRGTPLGFWGGGLSLMWPSYWGLCAGRVDAHTHKHAFTPSHVCARCHRVVLAHAHLHTLKRNHISALLLYDVILETMGVGMEVTCCLQGLLPGHA